MQPEKGINKCLLYLSCVLYKAGKSSFYNASCIFLLGLLKVSLEKEKSGWRTSLVLEGQNRLLNNQQSSYFPAV